MSTPSASLPRLPVPSVRALGLAVGGAAVIGAAMAVRTPWLVLLALAGPLVAVTARPDGATLCFAFGAYLNVPVLLARSTGVHAFTTVFVLLLLVPLAAHVLVRREALVVTPVLGLMVAFLGVLVVSAVVSGASATTAASVTGFATEGLVLYLLVTNAVRTSDMLRAIVWALLIAGAIMGAVSVWQELTHTYRTVFGGLGQVNVGDAAIDGGQVRPRLSGPIGEKNRYAQVLLVLLPLALWAARYERQALLRLAALGCGGFALCGTVLTFSRGGFVALVALVLAMLASGLLRLRHALALVLAFVAMVTIVFPGYVARLQTLQNADTAASQTSGADGAIRGRATENLAALHAFADHPLLGVGPGEFFARESTAYANALNLRFLDTRRRAHNLYLEMAADTGLVGLLVFLTIVAATLVGLWRIAKSRDARGDPVRAALARALALSIFAYLVSAVFLQLAYQRYFWFLIALANSAIWVLAREARRPSQPTGTATERTA